MSLFAHFPIVSYQPRTPLGQSINEYTAHLGKLNWSVFAFMCGSRGGVGGPNLLKITMLGTKNEELFSDRRAWTPPPSVKIHGSAHGKHSVLITTAQYRVRDIGLPIKGLWASLHPLTCHLSCHFAYMKCHSLAYFYKRLSCCWMEKEEGTTHSKV